MMPDEFMKLGGVFPIERADVGQGTGRKMSLEEFAQADHAIEQAVKFGNYEPLLERLRGTPLGVEGDLAADIIAEILKRPRHRIANPEKVSAKEQHLTLSVLKLIKDGGARGEKEAVGKVAEKEGVSLSQVRAAMKKHRDSPLFRLLFPPPCK